MAGLKREVIGSTPVPLYVPGSGSPPFNTNGLAFVVVMLSKQLLNVTTGNGFVNIRTAADVAGLPVTQAIPDVKMHETWSPEVGM